MSGSNFGILNWDSPTRLLGNANPSSPDVSLAPASLITSTNWQKFQRSWPTRGGTFRQQTTPANRNHYYPDSLLFVSAGFLPRVSSQRLN